MEKNNKKRLLVLLEYLKKNTDKSNRVSMNDILDYLLEINIAVPNRKTIYDDIKTLNDFGYDIEYDNNGYYLLEAPFSLSEIKIIIDSINSLKNLDIKLLNELNNKLYSFISNDEEKLLNKLNYQNKHKDKKLLQRLEDILDSIKDNKAIEIKKKNGQKDIVFPLFLYRANDYYYFYYHYENSKRIYHFRFDNIIDLNVLDLKDQINISRSEIIEIIEASSNAYTKGKSDLVLIKIINNNEYLNERFLDDFPNALKTKDGFSIKVNVNNIFFSKIAAYGSDIKIGNEEIAYKYEEYLKDILKNYLPEK